MQQEGQGEQQRPPSSGGGSGGERTGRAAREGGYDSDSDKTGPVLEGIIHTAGHGGSHEAGPLGVAGGGSGGGGPSAGSPRRHGHTHGHGDSDRSAAVVAGEAAAGTLKHAQQDAAAEAAEGAAHPTLHGKEQPGLFTRALGAAEELAASAAGKLKHGAQLATGTAPEQHPADQLVALQESIANMEKERAEDVAYQKAKKDLGM